ncbi:DUF192 domain-containing protein [Bizionia argentinensis JUB59]|uniref:DUF192 domain-containing protein n=1 Tax=Bizionia argentinensis JUB59 TaxID=1046627 RepID=G2ED58_9FLAO|nr:DUF192 domain-containing protein [Bizionia argentinensis]EGV43619.1 DUF192 domain-containing protein [Bizionia argentinensis JUB59]
MIRRYFKIICLSAALIALTATSCKEEPKKTKQAEVAFKKEGELQLLKKVNDSVLVNLDIEIADNESETQTGLMYRESMKINRGMLFIFPNEQPRSFFMKNTRIALDIIYLDANKTVVSFQENAQPFNEGSLPSEGAAKYVLEVNAGLVNTWQLEVGDAMTFKTTD